MNNSEESRKKKIKKIIIISVTIPLLAGIITAIGISIYWGMFDEDAIGGGLGVLFLTALATSVYTMLAIGKVNKDYGYKKSVEHSKDNDSDYPVLPDLPSQSDKSDLPDLPDLPVAESNWRKYKTIIIAGIVLVALIIFTPIFISRSCVAAINNQNQITNTPRPRNTSSSEETQTNESTETQNESIDTERIPPLELVNTYISSTGDYSFDYPEGWSIVDDISDVGRGLTDYLPRLSTSVAQPLMVYDAYRAVTLTITPLGEHVECFIKTGEGELFYIGVFHYSPTVFRESEISSMLSDPESFVTSHPTLTEPLDMSNLWLNAGEFEALTDQGIIIRVHLVIESTTQLAQITHIIPVTDEKSVAIFCIGVYDEIPTSTLAAITQSFIIIE